MGFSVTAFEPASAGHSGTLRGTRETRGTQNVTVVITCDTGTANVDASEDYKFLGQLEFKRGFFLAFTGTATQASISDSVARTETQRPLEQKQRQGLHVLLTPVGGLGAKLDFDVDLAAAGVLPLQVSIENSTPRAYSFDPEDITLAQADGTRVHPLSVTAAAERVATSMAPPGADGAAAVLDRTEITRRLDAYRLTAHTVAANHSVKGYLYFPLAPYVKGRVSLEDAETEEVEGFVVEF